MRFGETKGSFQGEEVHSRGEVRAEVKSRGFVIGGTDEMWRLRIDGGEDNVLVWGYAVGELVS